MFNSLEDVSIDAYLESKPTINNEVLKGLWVSIDKHKHVSNSYFKQILISDTLKI
ncbi:hypothetical protein [Clostridium rectalis]|uniref:hypothetical protein n=1 Tax=Clostridium rectalis TaxID=2040295 RepID=UPI0013DDC040|nr:hypothetical protein [Clostridium rectalis]